MRPCRHALSTRGETARTTRAAGAATVAQSGSSQTEKAVQIVAFVVIASLTVLAPLAVYLVVGLVIGIESLGIPLPGEIALVSAALLASRHTLEVFALTVQWLPRSRTSVSASGTSSVTSRLRSGVAMNRP
mgnify:CR=1 FL=1